MKEDDARNKKKEGIKIFRRRENEEEYVLTDRNW